MAVASPWLSLLSLSYADGRSWAFGSVGFAGQVAHDLDLGPQRQAIP
jgi:hypothetical protein